MSARVPVLLAALAVLVAGPSSPRFETTHGPKVVLVLALAAVLAWQGLLGWARWGWPERLGALALASAALGGVLALSPAYAAPPVVLLAAVGVVALGVSPREDRDAWWGALAVSAVGVAALGALEAADLLSVSLHGRAPASTMGQRNSLAHFLVLASPLVWWRALVQPRWLLGVALLAAVTVATRSRAAWLVGPLVLALFVGLTRERRAAAVVSAVVGGVALAALAPVALAWNHAHPYLDSLHRLVDWTSGSGAGRLREWRESLALFAAHPVLGLGPGQWFVEYGVRHEGDHFAHSDVVGLLVERGVVGALAWWGLGGALFVTRPEPVVRCVLAAAFGLGGFDAVLQLPAPLLLVTVVAFAGAHAPPVAVRPARGLALVLGALAVFASFTVSSRLLSTAASTPFARLELAARLDPSDAELRVTLAEAWISAGDCARAAPHLERAQRLLPRHPKLSALVAACPPGG